MLLLDDLNTTNIYVSKDGILKIFLSEVARSFESKNKAHTNILIGIRFQTPEILLGSKIYDRSIDMWIIGRIFEELIRSEPLFLGGSKESQLVRIFKLMGTPSVERWDGLAELPGWKVFIVLI